MPTDHTETQPNPNISTEHQREGDARRPSDTLDRGQPDSSAREGDERDDTPGGLDQERVEDRPNVSQVSPDDYPAEDRERRN
jgi:hypothetical protein